MVRRSMPRESASNYGVNGYRLDVLCDPVNSTDVRKNGVARMSQKISLDGRSGGAGVNSGRGESGALTFAVCSARVIKA